MTDGAEPTAARMAASVRSISLLTPAADSLVRYGWLKVWLPMAWPASATCLAMTGLDAGVGPRHEERCVDVLLFQNGEQLWCCPGVRIVIVSKCRTRDEVTVDVPEGRGRRRGRGRRLSSLKLTQHFASHVTQHGFGVAGGDGCFLLI